MRSTYQAFGHVIYKDGVKWCEAASAEDSQKLVEQLNAPLTAHLPSVADGKWKVLHTNQYEYWASNLEFPISELRQIKSSSLEGAELLCNIFNSCLNFEFDLSREYNKEPWPIEIKDEDIPLEFRPYVFWLRGMLSIQNMLAYSFKQRIVDLEKDRQEFYQIRRFWETEVSQLKQKIESMSKQTKTNSENSND